MKIEDLMVKNPITVREQTSIREAIDVMKSNSIRHLPVVKADRTLVGFLTLSDLKQGLIPSMVADLSLSDLMIRKPVTVGPDTDVEIAAQLIYKRKIGGLPVVEKGNLVGIITVTDILGAFINMMGILSASSRLDAAIDDKPGALKKAIQIIHDNGGDIINVAMARKSGRMRTYYFRLTECDTAPICDALKKEGVVVFNAPE
ncbi:MAG: CBS and ACT domain-containing protein [Desulfobacterales bacterium]|jgi:acetoin utilization protein AcuB